jgi:hypothetical protein
LKVAVASENSGNPSGGFHMWKQPMMGDNQW